MKTVGFEPIGNKRIFFILTEPKKTQNEMVIMNHGFRGSSTGPARTFVDFEKVLFKNGFSVLRFDQPNSGNSVGDYLTSSFTEWIDTTTYFAKKYIDKNYEVALLGQSMGGAASVAATSRPELRGKIKCLLLWVPDPKSTFKGKSDRVYEEAGQQYLGAFWQEAKEADFFGCLDKFNGEIHLVYGEEDRYISEELRRRVVKKVREKYQPVLILKGQDHSPWHYEAAQKVYAEQLEKLKECFSRK